MDVRAKDDQPVLRISHSTASVNVQMILLPRRHESEQDTSSAAEYINQPAR